MHLYLKDCNISDINPVALPPKKIKWIDLQDNPILESNAPNQGLWDLVRQSPFLGCIGCDKHKRQIEYEQLHHDLCRNRARSRMFFFYNEKPISFPLALWKLILENAPAAFQPYRPCQLMCCCCTQLPSQSDAIFSLLLEYGAKDIFFAHQEDPE